MADYAIDAGGLFGGTGAGGPDARGSNAGGDDDNGGGGDNGGEDDGGGGDDGDLPDFNIQH